MLDPDSAKQQSVHVHVSLLVAFNQDLDAFLIFESRAFSILLNDNAVASLSAIYIRKPKTEQLQSQHAWKDAVVQAVKIYSYGQWKVLK